jgi:hypothetical protein
VAVVGVLAQADVAGNDQVREMLADELDGEDNRALGVVGGRPARVLKAEEFARKSAGGARAHLDAVERDAKENDGPQSFGDERGEKGTELVDAPSVCSSRPSPIRRAPAERTSSDPEVRRSRPLHLARR